MRRGANGNTVLLALLAVVVVVGGGELAVRSWPKPPPPPDPMTSSEPPPGWTPKVAAAAQAPDFRLPDLQGRMRSLRDYRGKPLLVGFYGDNHRSEVLAREFQKIRHHIGAAKMNELAILCFPPEKAAAFLKKTGDKGVPLLASSNAPVLATYGVDETPLAWVVNEKGQVSWVMPPVRTDEVPEGRLREMTNAFRVMIPKERPDMVPIPDPFEDVRGRR